MERINHNEGQKKNNRQKYDGQLCFGPISIFIHRYRYHRSSFVCPFKFNAGISFGVHCVPIEYVHVLSGLFYVFV